MCPVAVSIPQPCGESWEAMTPAGTGRPCAACQRVVVDFTQQTDAGVLAYLAGAGTTPCGRFRAGQLGRALYPAPPVSRWRAWRASGLALGGVLGAGRAAAQARSNYAGPLPEASPATSVVAPPTLTLVAPPRPTPAAPAAGPGQPVVVCGVVLEEKTNEPVPFAAVLTGDTGAFTDEQGQFTLTLAAPADTAHLYVQSPGFHTQQVPLPRDGQPLTVRLLADHSQLMTTTGFVVPRRPRPWPWHPRSLFHWTRYQATQLRYRAARLLGR